MEILEWDICRDHMIKHTSSESTPKSKLDAYTNFYTMSISCYGVNKHVNMIQRFFRRFLQMVGLTEPNDDRAQVYLSSALCRHGCFPPNICTCVVLFNMQYVVFAQYLFVSTGVVNCYYTISINLCIWQVYQLYKDALSLDQTFSFMFDVSINVWLL